MLTRFFFIIGIFVFSVLFFASPVFASTYQLFESPSSTIYDLGTSAKTLQHFTPQISGYLTGFVFRGYKYYTGGAPFIRLPDFAYLKVNGISKSCTWTWQVENQYSLCTLTTPALVRVGDDITFYMNNTGYSNTHLYTSQDYPSSTYINVYGYDTSYNTDYDIWIKYYVEPTNDSFYITTPNFNHLSYQTTSTVAFKCYNSSSYFAVVPYESISTLTTSSFQACYTSATSSISYVWNGSDWVASYNVLQSPVSLTYADFVVKDNNQTLAVVDMNYLSSPTVANYRLLYYFGNTTLQNSNSLVIKYPPTSQENRITEACANENLRVQLGYYSGQPFYNAYWEQYMYYPASTTPYFVASSTFADPVPPTFDVYVVATTSAYIYKIYIKELTTNNVFSSYTFAVNAGTADYCTVYDAYMDYATDDTRLNLSDCFFKESIGSVILSAPVCVIFNLVIPKNNDWLDLLNSGLLSLVNENELYQNAILSTVDMFSDMASSTKSDGLAYIATTTLSVGGSDFEMTIMDTSVIKTYADQIRPYIEWIIRLMLVWYLWRYWFRLIKVFNG